MRRIVVVGGGISGTAAAFTARARARERNENVEIVLLERASDVGGKALSVRDDDWLFETGPLGYLNNEPVVDELAAAVGLEDEVLTAGEAQSHRFVYLDGRVREVRPNPLHLLASGVMGPMALLRAACEPWVPPKTDDDDESVWAFAARRLGRDFADRLIHPMVLGIFAGDAKRLSLASAFPLMAELEREHGSLVRAQIARSRARRRGDAPRRGELRSFRNGMQSLPRALSARGDFETRTSSPVARVVRGEARAWNVVVGNGGEPLPADAVILACEGFRAAPMLGEAAPGVAAALGKIRYPPVCVVALGYGPEARGRIPEGFGTLIPRDRGYRALGVTADGYLFPRQRQDRLLVRVLLGGSFDPEIATLDEDEVAALAESELQRLFELPEPPLYRRTRLWPSAIPQYELGHEGLVHAVETELERTPGLYLAGNALYGPSFGKAAARGRACGYDAVDDVTARRREATA